MFVVNVCWWLFLLLLPLFLLLLCVPTSKSCLLESVIDIFIGGDIAVRANLQLLLLLLMYVGGSCCCCCGCLWRHCCADLQLSLLMFAVVVVAVVVAVVGVCGDIAVRANLQGDIVLLLL
jgi:uncharacterized membrane protein